MALFQKSVLNKYLKNQDKAKVEEAYVQFTTYFHNPTIQENIRNSKEEQFQEGFLRELFVKILGYTLNPEPNFNLTTELKNEKGAKKADGAILKDGKALGVIELKGTDTTDLDKINTQAFNYKNNHTDCVYVVTSNFEKLRFFIHNAVEQLDFNLFTLTKEEFEVLWLCLNANNVLGGIPIKAKKESIVAEENITKQLYKDYSTFKMELWQSICKNSPELDQLLLFKKIQKLLDRFLFIFFAEDGGLLPPNSISRMVTRYDNLIIEDAYKPLYEIFKQYFGYINVGRKGKSPQDDIFEYNGGLFLPDSILDQLSVDDDLLKKHVLKLSSYDFQSEVDVNILGHIFENSLNEIENVTAQLEGAEVDNSKSKRKKDGVFYTPKYITKYIVENTIGKLCDEKKAELQVIDEEYAKGRKNRKKETIKQLDDQLKTYRDWLLNLTICDPACGSGAFLNQALDYLIEEHKYIDTLESQLLGYAFEFPGVENHILEKNIYGVDINDESVEIAKLSLWLRTAQRGRKLTSLNNNIKCGNSLIDDQKIAGDKAFNWQKEFPKVFQEKEKRAFHITWVTHNSRTSQRMIDHKVKKGDAYWLEDEQEVVVATTIKEIVEQDGLNVMAFNSCGDHIHLLLVCEEEEIPNIIRKLKGKSSQKLKEHLQIPKEAEFTLWAQKFSTTNIESEEQLWNTVEYIRNNRLKHNLRNYTDNKGLQELYNKGVQELYNKGLQELYNKGLQPLVTITDSATMQMDYNHAFRTEYKGGFDVVIGNPPYVDIKALDNDLVKALFNSYKTTENRINLYSIFIEKAYDLVKEKGFVSFINPNSILVNSSYKKIRTLLIDEMTKIIKLPDDVFIDAKVETIIFEFRKKNIEKTIEVLVYPKSEKIDFIDNYRIKTIEKSAWKDDENLNYNIFLSIDDINLLNKIKYNSTNELGKISDFCLGITPYDKYQGHSPEVIKTRAFHSTEKIDTTYKPLITGENILRFNVTNESKEYIKYGNWLGAMREERFFTTPRIIVRQIVSGKPPRIYAGYTEEPLYFTQIGFAIIPHETSSIKYILSLLNSKLITYYHKYQYLDIEKDLFQKILIANCKQLPIKIINETEQKPFIEKVDSIIERTSSFQNVQNQFIQLLLSKFTIEKLTTKLQNWCELEFGDFLKELEKARKLSNKESQFHSNKGLQPLVTAKQQPLVTAKQQPLVTAKQQPLVATKQQPLVTMKLSEQAEWMQYFNEQKQKAQALKTEIDKTDKEIDKMVYELYGLTEEEIKIVEGK